MGKEAFLIYTSFYKPISILSDKQLGRLFRAIFRYQLGEVVDVEEDIRMAFEFFKNQFEIDESKYQSKIKRDVENGHKGGNPNFKKGKTNPYYNKDKQEITQDNPNITQDNPGLSYITQDKANNDNDNDNDKENSNTPNVVLEKKKAAEAATLSRKENFGRSLIPYVEKYGKEMIRDFFDYWSEFNKSKSKMRFEQQPTWETSKRLATWAKRDKNYNHAKDTGGHEDKRRSYDVSSDVEKDYNSTF